MNARQHKRNVFGFCALRVRNRREVDVQPNLQYFVSPRCLGRVRMTYIIWKVRLPGRDKVVGEVGGRICIDLAIIGIG